MDKTKASITLGVVCLILTMAICVQIRTMNSVNQEVSKTFEENSLRDEVLKWKEKSDEMTRKLDDAEKKLSKVRADATKDDETASEIENQITENNNLLGLTDVEGPGVEITLKDDPNATVESVGVFGDISEHIIHDADLRVIVNELKNSGAEAISINGERLVNTTAITCIGNVIKVNDERISSPFTIKAIGLPESLASIDRPGGYVEFIREYGIVFTMKKSDNVKIDKYSGVISAKNMVIQK